MMEITKSNKTKLNPVLVGSQCLRNEASISGFDYCRLSPASLRSGPARRGAWRKPGAVRGPERGGGWAWRGSGMPADLSVKPTHLCHSLVLSNK